jgi:transcriptional regulator with XRE-family HTH domain
MRNPYSKVFANNLRHFRRAAGLTQAQLAEHIRLHGRKPSRSYITQLESGRIDPRLSTVRAIARVLNVKPWYLVCDLSDNVAFWDNYRCLTGQQKRDVQHHVKYLRHNFRTTKARYSPVESPSILAHSFAR